MTFLQVQIVSLILCSGVVGAWGMYQWLRAAGHIETKWVAKHRKQWEEERYQAQKKRLSWIHKWASERMSSVPQKCQTMDRQILVTYKDLLNVWDLTDKIEDNL